MTKQARERAARIAYEARVAKHYGTLPGVERPTLKEILALEAAKPLQGKARELGADSLFGDGMKQGSMF